jgi:TPR repeat protein
MIIPGKSAETAAPSRQLTPKKKNSPKGALIAMIGGVMIAAGAAIFFMTQGGNPDLPDKSVSKIEASEDSKESAQKPKSHSTSNTSSNDGKSYSSKEKASSEEIFQHGLRYFNGEEFPGQAALKRDVEPKDLDHALKLFLQAAETGHAEAQYYAAVCYGAAVPPKMQEAKRWIQQSADQGLTKAQYLLGVGYISGDFGEKDDTKGLSWIRKAADGHYADAQWFLGLRHLSGEGVSIDEKRAAALFAEAAEQDHAPACVALGSCYADGIGVENDPDKAVQWLAKAQLLTLDSPVDKKLGNDHPLREKDPEKQADFGVAYMLGKGLIKSKKNAAYLFQRSAWEGNRRGQYFLGLAYYSGDGLQQDQIKAVEWLTKSSNQGWPPAQFHLGESYFWGHGVKKDQHKALQLYNKALPKLDDSMRDLCQNRIRVLRDLTETKPNIASLKNATLEEARECVRLLDEQLKQDPENTRIQKVKNTITDIFREEASLVAAKAKYIEAEKLLVVEQRNLSITSNPSSLTGRVNQNEVARYKRRVNEAKNAIKNAKNQGEESRSNLQKLLNDALSGLPEEEREALAPVWQQVAKRHQIKLKK